MIYDLVIVGGGINGAAIARDAALRGLKCILLEKSDFGAGASTKTSKLAHGGIRYLEQFEISLVRESLYERELLLKNAPHLVHPLRFIHPIYRGDPHSPWTIQAGLYLYDFLAWCSNSSLPPHKSLSKSELISAFPNLRKEGICGALSYSDAQMNDERILIENILSAISSGADVFNDAEVLAIQLKQSSFYEVKVKINGKGDLKTIQGSCVVNATGAWALSLDCSKLMITKGVHLVLPSLQNEKALLLRSPRDQRAFFIIPWEGLSLVGTTDTPYDGDVDRVHVNEEDRDYLLEAVRYHFPNELITPTSVVSSFAGLRPLVAGSSALQPSEISRRFEVTETTLGFFTVSGGKYTTHRRVAEEVVNRAIFCLKRAAIPCKTEKSLFPGYIDASSAETLKSEMLASGLSEIQANHLLCVYGEIARKIFAIVKRDVDGIQPICTYHPHIVAEITYAVENELLKHLYSWFNLRTTIAYTPCRGRCCMHFVADKMCALLGWNLEEQQSEINNFISY